MYEDKTDKIVDRREMLRIKVKSLAAEANIIRKEEKKAWGTLRDELHNHRVIQLRKAARSSYIAYGLIRGRTLEQMENISLTEPDWNSVKVMLKKYGPANLVLPNESKKALQLPIEEQKQLEVTKI